MREHFEKLKKVSIDYKTTVDALAPDYRGQGNQGHLYSDEVKAKRLTERNAAFNAEIDRAAQKAAEAAAPEIAKLRAALQAYVTTSTDSDTILALQALLSAGVELSPTEIDLFAAKGGYGVLRLLEKPSKGHVHPPRLESFEMDLKNLENHFKELCYYRGELSNIGPGGFYGQSSTVGSAMVRSSIDKFPAKLDEMSERWNALKR